MFDYLYQIEIQQEKNNLFLKQ